MTELVKLQKNTPVTNTLIIAEETENSHQSVFRLVKKYKEDLEEFGVVGFEIHKPKKGSNGGRPIELAYLNEQQTTLMLTYMRNSDIVRKFKIKLVKEFYKIKKVLSEISSRQNNQEWIELRKNGKLTRKSETNTIKSFVEYAEEQGSKNSKMYFANISRMENKALFFIQEKFPNLREILTGQQLQIMSSADQIVEKAIQEGMDQKLHYKDIYKMAKERIETFASIIPKTIVPMIKNKVLADNTPTIKKEKLNETSNKK